jgi:hypothetical protein
MELTSRKHVTLPPDAQKNFLVVDQKTETSAIEHAFDTYTKERNDIAILLINQHVGANHCSIRGSDLEIRLRIVYGTR